MPINIYFIFFIIYFNSVLVLSNLHYFKNEFNENDKKYGYFSESDRLQLLKEAREMFQFGYDNYMTHAYPLDELDPVHCTGRGPDYDHPENININDVLGDYALTLIDSLDMLAIMGNTSEFKRAVTLITEEVSFHKYSTVQVFEVTIRILGGLLSAHLLIVDPERPFGDLRPWVGYDDELLVLAMDLASRLMPAFDNSSTEIPLPRVNLIRGVPEPAAYIVNTTCTSCAGSLVLEFTLLSRLTHTPASSSSSSSTSGQYERVARAAMRSIFNNRHPTTKLFGNVIDCEDKRWVGKMAGLGAGLDSFYEYMLKTYVLFGDDRDLAMFSESYAAVNANLRRGRSQCNSGYGYPPIYINVNMETGALANNWIDSLQAAWSGVQVLYGDIEEAICSHAIYYSIWQRYGALPERFNWNSMQPEVKFYPLRPELAESTYLLYKATQNPFYLHVGRDILRNIQKYTRVKCGYTTIHDILTMELEDRMESFFLSETCKYLFLLFDFDNPVNVNHHEYLFTTEGHVIRLAGLRSRFKHSGSTGGHGGEEQEAEQQEDESLRVNLSSKKHVNNTNCASVAQDRRYFLPLKNQYFHQLNMLMGLT